MKPVRIQRKRTRGWRMPENTVFVGRPSRWGNPWRIGDRDPYYFGHDSPLTREEVIDQFRCYVEAQPHRYDLSELRGKNLACWCALDSPCHADVLLDLANRPVCEPLPHPERGSR